MPTPPERPEPGRDDPPVEVAVDRALAGLGDADAGAPPADLRSLGAGLRLAIEHPEEARRLLELLDAEESGSASATAAEGATAGADAGVDGGPDASDQDERGRDGAAPVRSLLLARSAAMPLDGDGGLDPEVLFGWAGRLTRDEILTVGRIVGDMLAHGAPRDIERSLGIAWRGGVRLSEREVRALMPAFIELEYTVCGVLAGRDLRLVPSRPAAAGLASVFQALMPRPNPRQAEASMVLEHDGPPARRGLLALWNTWAAMRYRDQLSSAAFDELVRPWVSVVGPLPGA